MSTPLPSQLKLLRAVREVPRAAWDAVAAGAGPFLRWEWLDALEQSGSAAPERGWHPLHFTLWRGSKLVAAAPAYLKDHSHGEFVFDWSWASAAERLGVRYYPKLVLAVPLAPVTGHRVLVAAGEDRAARQAELMAGVLDYARSEGLSSVHVLFPTAEELPAFEAAGFATRLGVQYQWHNAGYRTFDDFLARFSSKRRHQLRRERRAPAEQGIQLRTVRGEELASLDPAEVFRLYCSTVDKMFWGRRHLTEAFFARVLTTCRDSVELVLAEHQGSVVAGAFNLATPEVLYGRYWGSFEEFPFLHFNVCQYYPVEECIRMGRQRFEPGAGGEHKLVRGFEPSLTYSAHWIAAAALDRPVRSFLATEAAAIREGLPKWQLETGFKQARSKDEEAT